MHEKVEIEVIEVKATIALLLGVVNRNFGIFIDG